MYHYVRPILGSQFPGIKGLELDGFKRQLDYLSDCFNIVTTPQVVGACMGKYALPDDACWLTFDDGYKDHFQYVLPELRSRGLHGAFFPPRCAIEQDIVLDVNAIHHILSNASDVSALVIDLNQCCELDGILEKDLSSLYEEFAVANRFDSADTVYVKRMLQHVLPESLRSSITSKLFRKYVGVSVEDFSRELYMNIDEVRELTHEGMYVGSHGSMHYWLDKLSPKAQEKDIRDSLAFLEHIGAPTNNWVMCYPYGSYNNTTLSLMAKYQASVGITTEVRVADMSCDNHLTLPRLDTNDFPQ